MSASSEQAFGTSRFEFGPATIRASAWRRYATQVGILIGWCGPGAVLAALVEGSWLVAFLAAIFALFCYLPARKRREVYVEYASLVDSRLGAFVDSMNSQAGSKEKYLEALPEQSGLLERQLRLVKPPKSLAQLHDAVAEAASRLSVPLPEADTKARYGDLTHAQRELWRKLSRFE